MQKLLTLLLVMFPCLAKSENAKLGSETDPIRQMLFASQSLNEQVQRMHLDGKPSPFQTIADAAALANSGKKHEAITKLRNVLNERDLETRIVLWVWAGLRELGEKPDEKSAYEVLGVIIEIPSGGAYDTLAAYVDGSARYLNFSGAAIFWDQPDAKVKAPCQALVDSTIPEGSRAKPRTSLALPGAGGQVTLLTRSGNYVITNPADSVIGPGAVLMTELMSRAKAKNAPPTN